MRFTTQAAVTAIAMLLSAMQAGAQTTDPLKAAVEKAVLTNPEVSARFHAYRAAIDAVDVTRAAYLPRIDLNASVGHDSDVITGRKPDEAQSFSRNARR
jgi:adhesin transport system outer membrane protein